MIVAHQRKSNAAAGICLASFLCILVFGVPDIESSPALATSVMSVAAPVAAIAYVLGLWFYIKAKGRSGWWILFTFLHVIGLVVIACLKDKSREPLEERQGELQSVRAAEPTFQSPRLLWPALPIER